MAILPILLALAATAAPDAAPVCTSATRRCLATTAHAYFDGLMRGDGSAIPFAADVRVTEQGHVVATSRAAFLSEFKSTGATKALRNMRMIIDETTGQVAVLVLGDVRIDGTPPFTVRRVQRMRIEAGLIKDVELVLYIDGNPAALWPDGSKAGE